VIYRSCRLKVAGLTGSPAASLRNAGAKPHGGRQGPAGMDRQVVLDGPPGSRARLVDDVPSPGDYPGQRVLQESLPHRRKPGAGGARGAQRRLADPLADAEVTLRDLLTHRTGVASHDFLWYRSPLSPEEFAKVRRALEDAGYKLASAEITMVPKSTVPLTSKEAQQALRFMETLEDHDDVQHVYANFDIPDEVLQQVG